MRVARLLSIVPHHGGTNVGIVVAAGDKNARNTGCRSLPTGAGEAIEKMSAKGRRESKKKECQKKQGRCHKLHNPAWPQTVSLLAALCSIASGPMLRTGVRLGHASGFSLAVTRRPSSSYLSCWCAIWRCAEFVSAGTMPLVSSFARKPAMIACPAASGCPSTGK